MGLNPFDSGDDDDGDEVYIGEAEEVVKEKDSSRSQNRAPSDGDTLETELEEKLVGTNQASEEDENSQSSDGVSLEDVHQQNEEIIELLEKINNKI